MANKCRCFWTVLTKKMEQIKSLHNKQINKEQNKVKVNHLTFKPQCYLDLYTSHSSCVFYICVSLHFVKIQHKEAITQIQQLHSNAIATNNAKLKTADKLVAGFEEMIHEMTACNTNYFQILLTMKYVTMTS